MMCVVFFLSLLRVYAKVLRLLPITRVYGSKFSSGGTWFEEFFDYMCRKNVHAKKTENIASLRLLWNRTFF